MLLKTQLRAYRGVKDFYSVDQINSIIDTFRNFFLKDKAEIEKNYSHYFHKYFQFYFSGQGDIKYYILLDKFRFDAVSGFGKKILDIGCGFGLHSILFSMFGAREITAIDFNEEKVEILKKLLNTWLSDISNIDVERGDALNLNFPDSTFDIVFSMDMISHVRHLEPVMSEINRVLKSGGVAYIDDGNNPFYLPAWKKRVNMWHEWEYGPLDPTKLRMTDSPLPFIEIRKNIIKTRFPQLDNRIVDFLARKTQGYYGDGIVSVSREFIEKKAIPKSPIFKYVNPITGEPMERPINPLRLKRVLCKYFSLKAQIVPPPFSPEYLGIKGILKRYLSFSLRKIPIISLLFHEIFIIIAKKEEV